MRADRQQQDLSNDFVATSRHDVRDVEAHVESQLLEIAAHLFDCKVSGASVDDVCEQSFDFDVSSIVLDLQLVNLQWLHGGHSQRRNSLRQEWLDVIEGLAQTSVELRVCATAFVYERCWKRKRKCYSMLKHQIPVAGN